MSAVSGEETIRTQIERLFGEGKSCTQCVFLGLQKELGVPGPSLLQGSDGLAKGLGGMGSLCGALVAGMMAIAISEARSKSGDTVSPMNEWLDVYMPSQREQVFQRCQELRSRFARQALGRFGSLNCRDISGVDWSNPSPMDLARYYAADGRVKDCMDVVAQIVKDILDLQASGTSARWIGPDI